MSNEIFNGRDLRFYGDSITVGSGASTLAKRWTSVFCTAVGAIEHNYGLAGQTLENGTQSCTQPVFDVSNITTKIPNDLFMFIALGTNDTMINNPTFTPNTFQTTLNSVINSAVSKGWKTSEIVLLDTYYMSRWDAWVVAGCTFSGVGGDITRQMQFVQVIKDVASNKGCILADTQGIMNASPNKGTFLNTDGVHPTDVGYQFIADYMQTVNYTSQSNSKNGMMLNIIFNSF